jgi:myosin-crossreactive antigen
MNNEKTWKRPLKRPDDNAATYLVGGGIASFAAAAFLVPDGDVQGHRSQSRNSLPGLAAALTQPEMQLMDRLAVYSLLDLERDMPGVNKEKFNPLAPLKAFLALQEMGV